MARKSLRLGVCTGGGDCPGLNAAVRAVVRHAVGTHGMEVVGLRSGLSGLMRLPADTVPLDIARVHGIHETGGTILGTNNKGSPFRDPAEKERLLATVKKAWKTLKLSALVVIGGDGTQLMAQALDQEGLPLVGVPKTIDNDLLGTDQTIGFATAVEVAAEAAHRLRTSAESHDRLMVLEVMGRDAGHIALAAGLAAGADAVLVPEIPYDLEALVERIERRRALGRRDYLVVAAEGAYPAGGTPCFLENRLGGIGALVARELAERTGGDARAATLGHVQRGGPACAADRILAASMGARAVDLVAAGRTGQVVAVRKGQLTDFPYRSLKRARRLLATDDPQLATAEAVGICLGRPSLYRAPA